MGEDEVLRMLEEETGETQRETQREERPVESDEKGPQEAPQDVGPEQEDLLSEDALFGSDAEAETVPGAEAPPPAQAASASMGPVGGATSSRRDDLGREASRPSAPKTDENDQQARFRNLDGQRRRVTPEKRGASGGGGDGPGAPASEAKRRKLEKEMREVHKGDRVWTHFRCMPKDTGAVPGVPGPPVAVKSRKPELAMLVEEISDGTAIVQFEKEEDEKTRIELYGSKRGKKIHGWLRYPRIFEGHKQRVPLNWVQWKRDPPKLCGCTKQVWGHPCDCGISCGRGASKNVWGVAS